MYQRLDATEEKISKKTQKTYHAKHKLVKKKNFKLKYKM